MDTIYSYDNYVGVKHNVARIMLYSRYSGQYVLMSRECFEIFDDAIKNRIPFEKICVIYDLEDAEYLRKLCSIMLDRKIIYNVNDSDRLHKATIESVYIYVTNRCNLNCVHCSNSSSISSGEEMPIEEVIRLIKLVSNGGVKHITISGGEPLIHKDFLKIAQALREIFLKGERTTTLMTNGTLFNESNLEDIVNTFTNIEFSIDGIDEESCSRIRGKGVFTKVWDDVKALKTKGVKNITISMINDVQNSKYIDEFYKLNEEMGTVPVIRGLMFIGRASENREILEDELNSSEKVKGECEQSRLLPKMVGFPQGSVFNCNAGKNTIAIKCTGEIHPCAVLTHWVDMSYGNVIDFKTFSEIQEFIGNPCNPVNLLLKRYEPEKIENCNRCHANIFCHGCIASIRSLLENPSDFKKWCNTRKDTFTAKVWSE